MKGYSALAILAVFFGASADAQVLTRVPSISVPLTGYALPVAPLPALPVLSLSAPVLAPSLPAPLSVPVPVALQAIRPVAAAPEAPRSQRSVKAFVLDLDGNAFGPGFPTTIILFHKNGNQELPVTTAEFATLEKKVGTDYDYHGTNLKDFELRGAASFRNFFGPQFTADLKYAVENLPEALWQGPSWAAMVHALSDPETANQFYVLTARQHTSEELLDGFRYLQAKGYIRYLPRVENLHGVGGTYRTAERKAELMADFADSLQATPGDRRPHSIGFSDDTWANFAKMRDYLLDLILANPGRWSRVKIVLFFTGRDGEHALQAVVLNNDGTTRPYIPGEPR